ncbi:GNAT family N-acetyltransferase [Bordetella avium]|nr:GNAT family N-acetyltransferase [Bordetella avium]AZY48202.1 GNAT family N-acetyltransferase [Bordetella avium]AZY51582.1 GNAT family N-acetyltransferase [Bordetella avium]RIQ13554.1 GNAT family N-acetyltransferase [Bordetella avium]RIQ16492.1 GNAT family N-acetyltransferase [Bordetella avium]RIQ31250.1 GNAT family N-acetyltransferase [Bordetella avium]
MTLILPFSNYSLQRASVADAAARCDYQWRNRERLRPWEPLRDEAYYTISGVVARCLEQERQMALGNALYFVIKRRDDGAMAGECGFTNIVRGPFQACYLGFSLDGREEGRGLMQAALQIAIAQVFQSLRLHRIMANYRPENTRSGALLSRLGFVKEGYARRYLKINGVWQDHVLTARTNEDEPD